MKKTILVTGATDGIGKMTAVKLALMGHQIIVHGRTESRVKAVCDEINKLTKSLSSEACIFDLGSLAQVKSGALELNQRFKKIDVLINNAGTYQVERQVNKDGFELTMAINHLGPTLLTLLLKPLFEKSPHARVVFVSSIAHNKGDFTARDFNFEKSFSAYGAYASTKLANLITAKKLAKEWQTEEISVYSLHPGVITTKLLKLGFGREGDSLEKGASTSIFLATENLEQKFNGEYFSECRIAPISAQAKSPEIADDLWKWTLNSLDYYR